MKITNDSLLSMKCNKEHSFITSYGDLLNNAKCPYCESDEVNVHELMRLFANDLAKCHRRVQDSHAITSITKLLKRHHKSMGHQGPTYEISARKYINLSISKQGKLVQTSLECNDNVCKHNNRICFCGEWELSDNVLLNNTLPELEKFIAV